MFKQFILFVLCVFCYTQSYLWPTTASKTLTSSFAESREDRFHTGIDITTWNKENYKCIAIDSGYVYRVRVGVYGYGKALYIKLKDGRVAVYAHLNRFMESLNDYVRGKQNKSVTYEQNLYFKPDQFPVNKGDLVAYTGSTGIGVPHLHFEIRSSQDEPINPLQFYPWFYDKKVPRFHSLYVSALDSVSAINDTALVKRYDIVQHSKKTYTVDTIYGYGNIGLSVDVSDPTIPEHRVATGVYSLSLMNNDSLVFKSLFQKLRFSENKYFNLDRNLYARKYFGKKVQNLFTHAETGLDYFGNGQLSLNEGDTLRYRIVISDYKKNKAELFGVLIGKRMTPGYFLDSESSYKNSAKIYNNQVYLPDSTFSSLHTKWWSKDSTNVFEGAYFTYSTAKQGLFESARVGEWAYDPKDFPDEDYMSGIVQFIPAQMPFRKPLRIQVPDSLPKNVGLYRWNDRKQRWDQKELNEHRYTTRSSQILTLIKDTIPPKIRFTKWVPEEPFYSIYIKDHSSGIRDERNFKLWSGKQRVVGEYDFEEHVVRIDKRDIIRGEKIRIQLKDNLGNMHERSIFIRSDY